MRRLVLVVSAVVAALLAAVVVLSLVRRPGPPPPGEVVSRLEAAGGATIARDCGFSQQLPADPRHSLWLFCDTPVYVRAHAAGDRSGWVLKRFISGGTAGLGASSPGEGPGELEEVNTPGTGTGPAALDTAPAPFMPTPKGLVTSAGQPCDAAHGAYPASWISGVTRIPASADLLITFNDFCVTKNWFVREAFGLVRYNPAVNRLGPEMRLFTGTDATGALTLGSPVFAGGYLYLFSAPCSDHGKATCAKGAVVMARVRAQPRDWGDPLGYQWWAGGFPGWTSDPAQADSIIGAATPVGLSVADFSAVRHGIVLIEQTDIGGGYAVFESRTPTGAWTKIGTGRVACGPGHGGFANFCRAIFGHPELSTRSRLVLSYYNPAASPEGHVMIGQFRW